MNQFPPRSVAKNKALMASRGFELKELRRDPGSGERFYVFTHSDRPNEELSLLTCELRWAHNIEQFHFHPLSKNQ